MVASQWMKLKWTGGGLWSGSDSRRVRAKEVGCVRALFRKRNVLCDLDRHEIRLHQPVLTGRIVRMLGRSGRPRLTNGGTYLHLRIPLPRWRGICDFPRTWAQRAVARAVGRAVGQSFRVPSVRPSSASGAAALRVPPTGAACSRFPPPPPSLSRLITYLLTYFLPIFLRRCEESQPAATSKRGGYDLQSVGYTMSGCCCCCCGGPI